MNFIMLRKKYDGEKIYVNPKQICFMDASSNGEGTLIMFSGDDENYILVLESPEAILELCKKVME